MARYIFIDRNSGFIFGDSANIDGKIVNGSPCDVAYELDMSIGYPYPDANFSHGIAYEETARSDLDATYDVYRADINGREAVVAIEDGQDQEIIEAVRRDCQYITTIRRRMVV